MQVMVCWCVVLSIGILVVVQHCSSSWIGKWWCGSVLLLLSIWILVVEADYQVILI